MRLLTGWRRDGRGAGWRLGDGGAVLLRDPLAVVSRYRPGVPVVADPVLLTHPLAARSRFTADVPVTAPALFAAPLAARSRYLADVPLS